MKTVTLVIIVLLYLSLQVSAAEITGKSYSPNLTPLKNVIVEINTQPEQIVVTDPSYTFTVNPGEYTLKARYENEERYYLEENLTVKQEGKFSHDLILFYSLEEEEVPLPDLEDINFTTKPKKLDFAYLIVFMIAVLLGLLSYKFIKKSKSKEIKETKPQEVQEIKEDLTQVLEILKQNNGRMNQKDLRKQLMLSEAKVSLMVSELESLNKLKRIKKGRANIIILT
ncbi:hypothetical protein HY498_05460 [Candidatus Woesearchaeota archaeon]|nr:hypothetical protein [Candidatus Woesearchaeota archaeon]